MPLPLVEFHSSLSPCRKRSALDDSARSTMQSSLLISSNSSHAQKTAGRQHGRPSRRRRCEDAVGGDGRRGVLDGTAAAAPVFCSRRLRRAEEEAPSSLFPRSPERRIRGLDPGPGNGRGLRPRRKRRTGGGAGGKAGPPGLDEDRDRDMMRFTVFVGKVGAASVTFCCES